MILSCLPPGGQGVGLQWLPEDLAWFGACGTLIKNQDTGFKPTLSLPSHVTSDTSLHQFGSLFPYLIFFF